MSGGLLVLKTKKYYDYDDNEYKGIRHLKDLFDLSIDEDYYKPIITNGAFNNNYIQYESRGNTSNTIIKHKTRSEWKIQLTIAINFISSEPDSDELPHTMHTKSDNVEIMMVVKQMKL